MVTLRAEPSAIRALRFDGQRAALSDAPRPPIALGEALIRPTRLAIASPDLAAASGRLSFRGTLGHEFVGVVEKAPDSRRWEGKRVIGSVHTVCGKCELCRAGLAAHCQQRTVLGLHNRDGCFASFFTLPL